MGHYASEMGVYEEAEEERQFRRRQLIRNLEYTFNKEPLAVIIAKLEARITALENSINRPITTKTTKRTT